jgi:hypothetical protein
MTERVTCRALACALALCGFFAKPALCAEKAVYPEKDFVGEEVPVTEELLKSDPQVALVVKFARAGAAGDWEEFIGYTAKTSLYRKTSTEIGRRSNLRRFQKKDFDKDLVCKKGHVKGQSMVKLIMNWKEDSGKTGKANIMFYLVIEDDQWKIL